MFSIDLRVLAFIVEIFANILPVDIAHGVFGGGNDAAVVTLDKAGRPGWASRQNDRAGSGSVLRHRHPESPYLKV